MQFVRDFTRKPRPLIGVVPDLGRGRNGQQDETATTKVGPYNKMH